ncbi:ribonuclease P protein component [Alphaproteobacteria bacterium]|nr:ribonuclease P protein component [Alphaproteobacteria bacterium]
MAQTLNTIKKRSTFLNVKTKGQFLRSFSFNIQILKDMSLDNNINVGYTATKRLGNAVKRNKAKRIMRELAKKVISKYGKKNFYYVIIAKNSLFKTTFKNLETELTKIIK